MNIFEFEKEWYKNRGVDSEFVGHPFLDTYSNNKDIAKSAPVGPEPTILKFKELFINKKI